MLMAMRARYFAVVSRWSSFALAGGLAVMMCGPRFR
jgi:hypothetical protein